VLQDTTAAKETSKWYRSKAERKALCKFKIPKIIPGTIDLANFKRPFIVDYYY